MPRTAGENSHSLLGRDDLGPEAPPSSSTGASSAAAAAAAVAAVPTSSSSLISLRQYLDLA